MKKTGVSALLLFLSTILILNIFSTILVQAQEAPPLPPEVRGIVDIGEKVTKEGNLSYVMKDWGNLFRENEFTGPLIESFDIMAPFFKPFWAVITPVFNFFFKYTVGLPFSWTWLFFLTLIIWIAIAFYIFRVFNLVSIFSKWMHYLISIGMVIILSLMGITKRIAEFAIKTVSLFDTWWMQLIGVAIIIVILVLAIIFSKNLSQLIKAIIERKKGTEEELNRLKLKESVKTATSFSRELLKK